MSEGFELPVLFRDKELNLPTRLLTTGYTYKLEVEVEDTKIVFEHDEEKHWRALIGYDELNANKKISVELLQAIASSIEKTLQ